MSATDDAVWATSSRADLRALHEQMRAAWDEQRKTLILALLAVEWGPRPQDWTYPECPGCEFVRHPKSGGHAVGCPINAALTAAGLPDQASRDEARKAIAEMRHG